MSELTRDGTTESVSGGQILRRELGEGKKQVSCSAGLATIVIAS